MHPERLGKYELIRHLASGGMARVYLAKVSGVGGFERYVVLKTVRPERTEDESYVTMFLDEARLVATLHHQHVAQVYEVGVADDGTYFLAMEYLHGETVRTVLEQARARHYRLPLDFALTVVCAAAAGLHHAHERRGADGQPLGIVHRDVSPSNVIIGYDGAVKLIDFGIAKAEARTTRTQTGFVKGKAGYMSPEQALGYPVDRRSDVFALGVLLYELTTQARAFRAASEYEAVQRIVAGDLIRPTTVAPAYPTELEDVVMTALETDPDDRFQDADAMRRAIEMTANHLGHGIGASVVNRVLLDLCGARPEPWLTIAPDEPDDTTVISESSPVMAMAMMPRPMAGPVGVAKQVATMHVEADESPTCRFMTVDSEPPRTNAAVVVGRTVTPPPIPRGMPPRMAAGSVAPPRSPLAVAPPLSHEQIAPTSMVAPRAPTVNLRVTPQPRPAPLLAVNFAPTPTPTPALAPARPSIARGTGSGSDPVVNLRGGNHGARISLAVAAAVLAVGVIAMMVAGGGEPKPADVVAAPTPAARSAPAPKPEPKPPVPPAIAAATRPRAMQAPAPAPAPTSPASPYVTLQVLTDPAGATVVLDGVRLGKTPFVGTLPREPREGWLKLRKQGYVPKKIRVRLDQDVTWDMTLPRRR